MNTNNRWIVLPETTQGLWNPVSDIRREFDRLFDDWGSPVPRGLRSESGFFPACDIEEGEGHYLLTLEVAGIKKDDIKLEVNDGVLTISGERQYENKKGQEAHWYSERRFGKFQRSFALPAGADAARVEANYQDGILRVLLPKAETAKPRQIKITTGAPGFLGKFLGTSNREAEPVAS